MRNEQLTESINTLHKEIYEQKFAALRDFKRLGIENMEQLAAKRVHLLKAANLRKQTLEQTKTEMDDIEKENNKLNVALKVYQEKQKEKKEEEEKQRQLLKKQQENELKRKLDEEAAEKVEIAIQAPILEDANEFRYTQASYKEMKYKKYSMNSSGFGENLSNSIQSTSSNVVPTETESALSFDLQPSQANKTKIDMVDRMNSMISRAMLDSKHFDSSSPQAAVLPASSTVTPPPCSAPLQVPYMNGHNHSATPSRSSSRASSKDTPPRTPSRATPTRLAAQQQLTSGQPLSKQGRGRPKKIKVETTTLKTTKKDSQVVMKHCNGMPTTQVIHMKTHKAEQVSSASIVKMEHDSKPFSLKLKIDCKANKVAFLDETSTPVAAPEIDPPSTCSNKRKSPQLDESPVSYSCKRTPNSDSSRRGSDCDVKVPPVVLKKSNGSNGQYYADVEGASSRSKFHWSLY